MSTQPAGPVQNPLTLIMTLKSEADYHELHQLLQQLQSLPSTENPIAAALDKLAIVHFARFTFMNDGKQLAVITSYDGDLENYLNEFVDEIGDIFNMLLSHMEGAPPLPVQAHRQEFFDYVRRYDVPSLPPFYSAYPTLTVLDILALAEAQQPQA